jgi:hypothetical protein
MKKFFESWIRHDPKQRPRDADRLRSELAQLRMKIWGRDYCNEEFKFRYEKRRKR